MQTEGYQESDQPPIQLYYAQCASLYDGEGLQIRCKSKDPYVLNLELYVLEWFSKSFHQGFSMFPSGYIVSF